MMEIIKKIPQKLFIFVFFLAFFLLGVGIYKDYGFSWDDPISRNNGVVAYEYVTGQGSRLLTYVDADYGTAFELPLVALEKIFRLTSTRQIYFMRHLATYLFFFIGTIYFYSLARRRYGWATGLLGVCFLILSPRIFADSFYNSKDVGLLSGLCIAVYTMTYFLDKMTWKRALVHGIVSAFVVDMRMPGIMIVGLTVGFFSLDLLFLSDKRNAWQTNVPAFLYYLLFFCLFTILFWPYLWVNPVGHFVEAYQSLSQFSRWDDTLLYFGAYIKGSEIPWHYPFVWIGITTPIVYLGLFFIGFLSILWRFGRNFIHAYKAYRDDLIFLSWFAVPLMTVVLFHSVLYDGWRQLYFIYPGFILTALGGIEMIKKRRTLLFCTGVIVVMNEISVVLFMVFYHPNQYMYFNGLAGRMESVKKNFELDYYGLTFRKGLEYIARTDRDPKITVFFSHGIQNTIDILPEADKKRFVPQDKPEGAKYILTNYRWHPQEYGEELDRVYAVAVDGAIVMSVYKFY